MNLFPLLALLSCAAPSMAQPGLPDPAAAVDLTAMSERVKAVVRRIDAEMSAVELGRRLIAATQETPILERRDRAARAVRYAHARQALVVNPDRLLRLPAEELELDFVRERARASLDFPIAVVEDEQSAYQTELEYALEKAAVSQEFGVWLRSAYQRAQTTELERRQERARLRAAGVEPGLETQARTPKGAMVRLGLYLYLFSEDPDEFYWIVERDQVQEPAVRFSEISDFMELHGRRLAQLQCPPSGRYCWLEGRSYPRRVADGALSLGGTEGIQRVRECVGIFQTKALPVLRQAVNRWVRGRD